jgi:plastocyanin
VKTRVARGRLFRSFIPALVIALFVVGIGAAAAAENAGSAATVNVAMGDDFFNPATTNVNVGDTVVWTHTGQRPHDVTADNGAFSSPRRMMGGSTFSYTATTAGTYNYQCTIHAGMDGVLVVMGAPGAAPRTGGGGMIGSVMLQWQQIGALAAILVGGSALLTFLRLRRRA